MGLRRLFIGVAVAWWAIVACLAVRQSRAPVLFGRYSTTYAAFLAIALGVGIGLSFAAVLSKRLLRPAWLDITRAATLLCVSTVLSLALLEWLIRSCNFLGVSFFQEATYYVMDLVPDPHLVYRHQAGLSKKYQGVVFEINEIGLRDRPLVEKSQGTLRALLLGDSVTLGWGVPVEETFARRLEALLAKRLGRPVQTINSAVSGYNTEQELGFLRQYRNLLRPDLLLLVYVFNDVEQQATTMNEVRQRWSHPPGASAFLLRWCWLYRLLYHFVPHLISMPRADREALGWKRSLDALVEIDRVAKVLQIPLGVALFRMAAEPVTDALEEDLRAIATREGFVFADMLPWFAHVDIEQAINSIVDRHPNARGHEIIASGLADLVVDRLRVAPPGGSTSRER